MATRTDRGWLLIGYAGVGGFLALEALTRKPGPASSMDAGPDDQGTTRMIVTGYALAALAPMLACRPTRRLPPAAGPMGLVLQAGGLALRTWSMRVLAASYTRTLRTADNQRIVEAGPYRLTGLPS